MSVPACSNFWYLHSDFADDARPTVFVPEMFRGGFPDSTASIAELLAQPDSHAEITSELERFADAYAQDRGLMRFHYHKPQELLNALRDLRLPRREYASELTDVPPLRMFVTQDEADAALANGSSFEGGKSRIYAFFTLPHSPQEKADFLKKNWHGRQEPRALRRGRQLGGSQRQGHRVQARPG